MWDSWAPLKVQGFIWKVARRRVPILERLQIMNPRQVLFPNVCVMCYDGPETIDHLFVHCNVISSLWKRLLDYSTTTAFSGDLLSIVISMKRASSLAIRSLWDICIHALTCIVLLVRNRRVFEDISIHIKDLWFSFLRILGVWVRNCIQFRVYSLESFVYNLPSIHSPQENGS